MHIYIYNYIYIYIYMNVKAKKTRIYIGIHTCRFTETKKHRLNCGARANNTLHR